MIIQKWQLVTIAVLASLLIVADAIFLVVLTNRRTSGFILAIINLILSTTLTLFNAMVSYDKARLLRVKQGSVLALSLTTLAFAGTIPSMALLNASGSVFENKFCGDQLENCTAQHAVIMTAYVLWFASGLAQATYTVLLFTIFNHEKSTRSSLTDRHLASPMRPATPDRILRTTQVQRIPIIRQDTPDEPFSYEAALQAKSAVNPSNHHSSQSSSSQVSNVTFVETHISHPSHSRSWASTLPTAVSGLSPRSFHGSQKHKKRISDDRSTSTSRRGSPIKLEWSAWGMALGSPRHKIQQENTSVSTTSTGRSRPTKSLKSFKFHLPSSSDVHSSSLDLGTKPSTSPSRSPEVKMLVNKRDRGALNPLGLEGLNACPRSRSFTSPRLRKKSPSKSDELVIPFPPLRSMTGSGTLLTSPERRRASFLDALRPKMADDRSPSRHSWLTKSITSSPTKSHTRRSSVHSLEHSPTEDAFAQWDTSNVERDPSYLVSMKDSRDISGSSPYPQTQSTSTTRRTTNEDGDEGEGDDESLWGARSIRVASDGSIFARDDHHVGTFHKLSSKFSPIDPAF